MHTYKYKYMYMYMYKSMICAYIYVCIGSKVR